MPDRVRFAFMDKGVCIVTQREAVQVKKAKSKEKAKSLEEAEPNEDTELPPLVDSDSEDENIVDAQERQERCILAASAAMASVNEPNTAVVLGPGVFQGPLRLLPPGKVMHLWWEYRALEKAKGRRAASYPTFWRVFKRMKKTGMLSFRRRGQHAKCSKCEMHKKKLRQANLWPAEREREMEEYSTHLVEQWLDRQVYDHFQEMSMSCTRALQEGHLWASTMLSTSALCIAVDGMDQAKFRVPRKLTITKAFERLLRPAMHVQGCWAHGAGYALAVADADMKKDSAGNVEVIARMIDSLFRRWKSLPLGLHLQQDNTSRECKNQKTLKFAIGLVAKGVFRWITLGFLITGHTHINLDGTYGQLTTKLSEVEFDDDMELVEYLNRFVADLGIDKQSRDHAIAYKLDEAAKWEDWWDQLGMEFNNLTGPDAPHYFRVCLRKDLGELSSTPHNRREELRAKVQELNSTPHEEDIMMVVKARMHHLHVTQVLQLLPNALRRRMFRLDQPQGLHARRPGGNDVKKDCHKKAMELYAANEISTTAMGYLTGWAAGTRLRHPRPAQYEFLSHRWAPEPRGFARQHAGPAAGERMKRLRVSVVGVSGQALPAEPESEDDAPLVGVMVN